MLSAAKSSPIHHAMSWLAKRTMVNVAGKMIRKTFEFKPYQSLMLKISPKGEMEIMDISFVPKDPAVREREEQKMYF